MTAVLGVPKGKGAPFSKRKLEVLRAAAKLFNVKGFNATSMDDIAKSLNVTKPALYYYAKSKDEILYQIGSTALREASANLTDINQLNCTGAARLRQFFIVWTESICLEFGRCLVLVRAENLEGTSRVKSKRNRRKVHDAVVDIIQAGVEDCSIKPCNPTLTALALFDLFNGIAYWHRPDGELSATEIAEQYWQNFAQGFAK